MLVRIFVCLGEFYAYAYMYEYSCGCISFRGSAGVANDDFQLLVHLGCCYEIKFCRYSLQPFTIHLGILRHPPIIFFFFFCSVRPSVPMTADTVARDANERSVVISVNQSL